MQYFGHQEPTYDHGLSFLSEYSRTFLRDLMKGTADLMGADGHMSLLSLQSLQGKSDPLDTADPQ
jgi:hypothetical protein